MEKIDERKYTPILWVCLLVLLSACGVFQVTDLDFADREALFAVVSISTY